MPLNITAHNVALDGLDESIAAGIKFVGVSTAADPGTGTTFTGTEAAGGSPAYARVAVVFAAAATETKANSGALAIDVPAGTYGFLLFFNAGTGNAVGNYLGYAPINGTVKGVGTADATTDLITSYAHGLTTDNRVQVFDTFGQGIPTGLTEGQLYFVLASGLTTDAFKVSATSGGAAIDITASGEIYFQKIIPEVFASQGQITVAAGALVLDATAF